LLRIADQLVKQLQPLRFAPPVTHVYNPLEYARAAFEEYVRRYGRGTREVVLVGMNPGPWGMAQTGVPFGEVSFVRDWLKIRTPVGKPVLEHPKRPIRGFDCPRREVSGMRLWGWAKESFGTPERFFERFFVVNYCPLVFMEATGRNRTPDRLPASERDALFSFCDAALRRTVATLRPRFVIGLGKFVEQRARAALRGMAVTVGGMLHPSPASPTANRGWTAQARADLSRHGILACP